MRHFNVLALLCVSTIALSACGGDQPEKVGTKDDIIVTNRGLPSANTAVAAVQEMPERPGEPIQVGEPEAYVPEQIQDENEVVGAVVETVTEKVDAAETVAQGAANEKEAAIDKIEAQTKEAAESLTTPVTQQVVEPAKEIVETPMPVSAAVTPATTEDTTVDKNASPTMVEGKTATTTPADYTIATSNESLNCDPNKLPANAVAGGCYARAVIPRSGTKDLNCMELRQILCKANMSIENVKRIQTALNGKGYKVPIDGVFGDSTIKAMDAYQRKNTLATNALTYESLRHLGVDIVNPKN